MEAPGNVRHEWRRIPSRSRVDDFRDGKNEVDRRLQFQGCCKVLASAICSVIRMSLNRSSDQVVSTRSARIDARVSGAASLEPSGDPSDPPGESRNPWVSCALARVRNRRGRQKGRQCAPAISRNAAPGILTAPRAPSILRALWTRQSSSGHGADDEAHLSALEHLPQADARLPGSYGHQDRTTDHHPPSVEGAQAPRAHDLEEVALAFDFPRGLRIRRSADYRRHRRRSRTFRTAHFLIAWASCPAHREHGRVGLTVSKKVGNSPQRSRVKRLLREWYRLNRHSFRDSWDLVIIARPGAATLKLQDVERELGQLRDWLNRRPRNPRRHDTR